MTDPEIVRVLRNIRMSAARGRVTGHHRSTPMSPERQIEKKDKALDDILRFCAEVGVVGSILRAEHTPRTEEP